MDNIIGGVGGPAENAIGRQMNVALNTNNNNIVESDYDCKMRLLGSLIDREERRRKRCTEELQCTMAHSQEILDQIKLLKDEIASVRKDWHKLEDKNISIRKASAVQKLYNSMEKHKFLGSQNASKLKELEKQVEEFNEQIDKLKDIKSYFQIKEELQNTYGTPKDDVDQFLSEIIRMYSRIYDKILDEPDEDRVTQFIVHEFRRIGTTVKEKRVSNN